MRLLTMSTFVLAASLTAIGAEQAAPVQTVKDGILDEAVLYVQKLDVTPATAIVIKPFSATDSDLGTGGEGGKDTRKAEAKQIQEQGPGILGDAFVAKLKELGPPAAVSSAASGAADAVVVEGKFTTIDPGSRTKRYFVGFGAGKSIVEVSGTIKTGDKVLATFKHKRLGVMGAGGGDSLKKLSADTKSIGEDIAKFVSEWAKGKSLK
jgi:uncharacterized protein DUF4410